MSFNFFDWIRDGVRRSVLLGVSDAVEQMGAPPEEEAVKGKMLSFFQEDAGTPKRVTRKKTTTGQRKLGRSIKEIQAASEAG